MVKKLVKDFHWDHQITLPNGEVTHGRWLPMFDEYGLNEINFNNKNVLDIGCLNGLYSFYAEKRGGKVVSIDITEKIKTEHIQGNSCESYLFAHSQFKSKAKYVFPYSVYDIENLGTFNIVLCLGVIYHLAHPLLAIEKINNVLKKGGLLIIETEINSGPSIFYSAAFLGKNPKKIFQRRLWQKIAIAIKHFLNKSLEDKLNLIKYTIFSRIKNFIWQLIGFLYSGNKSYKNDPSNFWIFNIDDLKRLLNFMGFQIIIQLPNAFSSNRVTLICKKVSKPDEIYAHKSKYTNYKNRVTNIAKFSGKN